MTKVALIGIGGMGFNHFKQYEKIEDAQVIAVADVRTDMAKEKVADENIHIYASMDELLANETPDMIDICTPSYLHVDMSIKALELGYHVLCEKPMALTSAETARIRAAAEKSDKNFMVAHVVRFMTPYMYLKQVIDSGELGGLVHLDMKRLSSIPTWSWNNWMMDVEKSGATPIDLSIHDLDFVQYVLGQPKHVCGVYRKLSNNSDYIVSNLVYDDFAVAVTGGWFKCEMPFTAEYKAMFENGYVTCAGGDVIRNGEKVELTVDSVSEDTGINISGASGYGGEIRYFIECMKQGIRPSKVTPESSEASVRLVERILENAILI